MVADAVRAPRGRRRGFLGFDISMRQAWRPLTTETTLADFDAVQRTVFGAADVRRQRFVTGW